MTTDVLRAADFVISKRSADDTSDDASKTNGNTAITDAPPSSSATTGDAADNDLITTQIVWRNVILFIYLHLAALYGCYLALTVAQWATVIWSFCLYLVAGYGITGGAHRLWAHRSYKAKWPLRLTTALAQTLAVQNSIYEWSRDHRVHHKFSETDADPHNARRGFFFAHMGWLLCKKHPEVLRRGKTVDMSDLLQDPIVVYQQKFYMPLVLALSFAMPTLVPWYYWGETLRTAYYVSMFRYAISLHVTWLVNSAAHLWGSHPYDKSINPAENRFVAFFAAGEGWHNFHHVFPWDYKTAELSNNYGMNMTSATIDIFAWFGFIYDRKTVPEKVIYDRLHRTGDGTHPLLSSLVSS